MNNKLKSLIASVLAVVMIFALAACGKSGEVSGKGGSKTGRENAPDFVYVSSFREIDNDNSALGAACFTDRGFYSTPSEIVGRREPDGFK